MGLLDHAQAAHDQRRSAAAAKQLVANNAVLKRKLKDIFGIDVDTVDNRYIEDGVTLMVHDNGNLHVLHTCAKCRFEYRSFQKVHTVADLHIAATEAPRTHPPCNGVGRQQPVTLEISREQVTTA